MKNMIFRLLLLVALLALPAANAAEAIEPGPYAQAVTVYVTAADQQLQAIRKEVDLETKNASETLKRKYAAVYAELERSGKLLEALKGAEPKDFDRLKADFERTREEMVKKLGEVRRGK